MNLAHRTLAAAAPRSLRHSILQGISEQVGETVNYGVLSGSEVIYLDRVEAKIGLYLEMIPIWTVSHNAALAIVNAAIALDVDTVIIGASRRSAFYHMLRGHVVKGLMKNLPRDCHLLISN